MTLVVGCAGGLAGAPDSKEPARPSRPPAVHATARPENCDAARDRAAILSMAGTFEVSFAFDETEPLAPGYTAHEPYRASATEHVAVLEQSEQRVVLQHVLLIEKHSGAPEPMKHWRQDWTFEDRELLEYRGRRVWEHQPLEPRDARCTWSQAVFEVDDGPRYESYGHFVHDDGAKRSTWVSAPTWRPLPRREYTERSDYDVLVAENRHVMSAQGWLHEQDNVKLVLEGERALVREHGENRYQRVAPSPASASAERYLEQTGAFWAAVRAEWQRALARDSSVRVHQELAGQPLHQHLFPLARNEQLTAAQQQEKVRELVAPYVESISTDRRSASGP